MPRLNKRKAHFGYLSNYHYKKENAYESTEGVYQRLPEHEYLSPTTQDVSSKTIEESDQIQVELNIDHHYARVEDEMQLPSDALLQSDC